MGTRPAAPVLTIDYCANNASLYDGTIGSLSIRFARIRARARIDSAAGFLLVADLFHAHLVPPPNLIGKVLDGRYRIVKLLGHGGMGNVYEAIHLVLDRRVAVKTLHPRFAYEERFRERFVREAKSASRIQHRNVVQITDFGNTSEGAAFFVMEYLEGRDLRAVLRKEGKLGWPRTRHILLQAVSALGAAHKYGIIHRDIKPGNCFLYDSEMEDLVDAVKLLDFGIAKVATDSEGAQEPDGKRLTGTGEVFGTATYMAPEQARGEPLDVRSDIYSLGIMIYEMLTGKPPFEGVNPIHVIARHLSDPPTPPRQLEPSIPPCVESLILKTIAKNPKDRFESMAVLHAAIKAIPESPQPVQSREKTLIQTSRPSAPPLRPPSGSRQPVKTQAKRPVRPSPETRASPSKRTDGTRIVSPRGAPLPPRSPVRPLPVPISPPTPPPAGVDVPVRRPHRPSTEPSGNAKPEPAPGILTPERSGSSTTTEVLDSESSSPSLLAEAAISGATEILPAAAVGPSGSFPPVPAAAVGPSGSFPPALGAPTTPLPADASGELQHRGPSGPYATIPADGTNPPPGQSDRYTTPLATGASGTGPLAQRSGVGEVSDTSPHAAEGDATDRSLLRRPVAIIGTVALVGLISASVTMVLTGEPSDTPEPKADISSEHVPAATPEDVPPPIKDVGQGENIVHGLDTGAGDTGDQLILEDDPTPPNTDSGGSTSGLDASLSSGETSGDGGQPVAGTEDTGESDVDIDPPTTSVPPYRTDACIKRRKRVSDAARRMKWNDVLKETKLRKCWSSSQQLERRKMIITAYLQLGQFKKCVEVGKTSKDPSIKNAVKTCKKMLDK